MISDVPLGSFLSGGIDSSVITAIASGMTDKLKTFSIGYADEPMFDETKYALEVSEMYKTDHHVFKLTSENLYEHLFDVLNYLGEPFADSSALPTYILSHHVRKHVTVALSGDGADELFSGYRKHEAEYRHQNPGWVEKMVYYMGGILKHLPQSYNSVLSNKIRQLNKFAASHSLTPSERYWMLATWAEKAYLRQLFVSSIWEEDALSRFEECKRGCISPIKDKNINSILEADLKMLLPNDMLFKVDSMSMANSLEVRTPFLDHHLVGFANTLPASFKINNGMKKRVLQDAFRAQLPPSLYRRPKHGFDVPLMKMYQKQLRSTIEELWDEDFLREQGVFQPKYMAKMKLHILNGKSINQNQVWAILVFQYWWKNTYLSVIRYFFVQICSMDMRQYLG